MKATQIIVTALGNYQGHQISQYTLSNTAGLKVNIMNYGATITSIITPTQDGQTKNIACGFDSLEGYFSKDYLQNAPYFGCTVGRYASRIKDGKFTIDGQDYNLAVNNGPNHLHGGLVGFDKKVWTAEILDDGESHTLKMSLLSEDMEEGYPGNVTVEVTFTLSEENELSIHYDATTDKTTPLSLTNHTYFNLSGFSNTIEQHRVKITSTTILEPDHTNVPVGKVTSVLSTAADLSTGRALGECFAQMETGFEHYYTFDKPDGELALVAEIADPQSGLQLEILTTEPGGLFYTGFFTSDKLQRENGEQYGKYRGFCFETSRYPNGPNIPNSPRSLTNPGERFRSKTVFKFIQKPLT